MTKQTPVSWSQPNILTVAIVINKIVGQTLTCELVNVECFAIGMIGKIIRIKDGIIYNVIKNTLLKNSVVKKSSGNLKRKRRVKDRM